MTRAELDYRFAWRWLLPSASGCGRLVGFDERAACFWQESLPDVDWSQPEQLPNLLLVEAGAGLNPAALTPGLAHTDVVAVVAPGALADRWCRHLEAELPYMREYGLLPASRPRMVVPLSSLQHAMMALSLHRPGRLLARMGVWVANLLARVGNYRALRRQVLLIATRNNAANPHGAQLAEVNEHLADRVDDFALYLGTLDDNRKTVVLPLGPGEPQTLLKVAASLRAREAVRNEATALRAMAHTSLAKQVPTVDALVEAPEALTLYQSYRARVWCPPSRLESAAVRFLRQLVDLEARQVPLAEVLSSLPAQVNAELSIPAQHAWVSLRTRLLAQAERGLHVHRHRGHGDFAPWNCAWTKQGFFVFDWEESHPQTLALGDAFYYSIAPRLHTRRGFHARKAVVSALRMAGRILKSGDMVELNTRAYFALWLMIRFNDLPNRPISQQDRVQQMRRYGDMVQALATVWHE